jgi:anti-sigma regulatory factor (Ser/Thr protein kinase)
MDIQPRPASTSLAPAPTAPREARRFVHDRLPRHASEDLVGIVELLTCEAVTNAVLHARTRIDLRLEQTPQHVRVEVADRSPALPRPRHHDDAATTGRGMHLIDSLACAWGVEPRGDAKVLWFEVCG